MSLQKPGSIFMKTPLELMNEMRAAEIRSDSKLKNALAVKDRQQAVQRYKWNLDPGSSGLEIGFDGLTLEAMLYERGIVGAGEVEPGVLDLFNVAWSGGIDRYRRMRNMKPIFPTGTDDKGRILEGAFDKEFEIVYLPLRATNAKEINMVLSVMTIHRYSLKPVSSLVSPSRAKSSKRCLTSTTLVLLTYLTQQRLLSIISVMPTNEMQSNKS